MEYTFIGWCNIDNHDKVWGVIKLTEKKYMWSTATYLTFWGARGKALQTKVHKDAEYRIIDTLIRTKKKKYTSISPARLDDVYPEFKTDLEKSAMIAILGL